MKNLPNIHSETEAMPVESLNTETEAFDGDGGGSSEMKPSMKNETEG